MKQIFLIPLLTLFCYQASAQPVTEIALDSGWYFTGPELAGKTFPATVPGVIHTDLMRNFLIGDPYWENNEILQRWIERENWTYSMSFSLDEDQMTYKNIDLVFEGLDTYANVYLNDSLVLEASNMFRTWEISIIKVLKPGENHVRIEFISPLTKHAEVKDRKPELPAGNETVELKVSPYTRKAAYHFGWDFAPRMVTCGIWRPVFLRLWNDVRISDVQAQTTSFSTSKATVELTYEIVSDHLSVNDYVLKGKEEHVLTLEAGKNYIKEIVEINNPNIWYPNGYGEQKFTYFNYYLQNKERKNLQAETLEYGIRKIELIQENDEIGRSFYFRVNNIPVFIKGANYVPQDMFLPRVKPGDYEELILQVKRANMNMIRIWGGGIYESDYFYELCDRNGIMVWQDFMFANAMYPSDSAFHHNIRQEIKDNIKRLRNHACLAVWCGNNEIEVGWNNWGWQEQYGYSDQDSAAIWNNYRAIFHEMIPDLLQELAPGQAYTPTTPLSNWGTRENFNHSTMHYWGVWHGREPLDSFKVNVGRFMVEYGFQSYPELASLSPYIADTNRYLQSDAMQNRQKSYIGNDMISQMITAYFGQQTSLKAWCHQSQEVQRTGLEYAIAAHRMKQGFCMGTMLWQLNDCWPGPSWSIIDYSGKPKTAYWSVKNLYEPIAVYPEISKDSIIIYIFSDLPDYFNGTGKIACYPTGDSVQNEEEMEIALTPLYSGRLVAYERKALESKMGSHDLSFLIRIFNKEDRKRVLKSGFSVNRQD